MTKKYRVLIADDHAIFRAGLVSLLNHKEEIEVIKEVSDGNEALKEALVLKPDLIIMDLSMPNVNGTESIEKIRQRNEDIKILALTVHRQDEYIRATFKAGANGYALKDDTTDDLFLAIRCVLEGRTYISPTVSEKIIAGYLDVAKPEVNIGSSWDTLTRREREVVKLVAEGKKNREIAQYLSLSMKTVEKHRSNSMRKLNLSNTSALVTFAINKGLVNN